MMNSSPSPPASRSVWIAIVVLGLMNVVMALVLWGPMDALRPRPHGPDGALPRGPEPFSFLVDMVRMDDAQQSRYRDLRDAHREAVAPLRERVRELRRTLFDHLPAGDMRRESAELDSIAVVQRQADSITLAHFRTVRGILRADQHPRFDAVIGEMARMMNTPPPPRKMSDGPPTGHDGPPPPPHRQ